MTKKERMIEVVRRLKDVYPEAVCALHYTHDYELLFATRLSAQCTDARVNIVTERLFSDFPTLQSFAEASEEDIAAVPGIPAEVAREVYETLRAWDAELDSSRERVADGDDGA